jgi:hypothetical protein
MTQEISPGVPNLDVLGFELPTPEEGLAEAKRRIALTLRRSELAWLLQEKYDPTTPAWNIDVVRMGANGAWVRQRARFDEQAQVLYFMGETPLSDAEFRAARKQGQIFPVAEWQDRAV